jgi:hypothetical protein
MYIVPTAPGKSRVMWSFVMPKKELPFLFKIIGGFKPVWLDHLTRNAVFGMAHAHCADSLSPVHGDLGASTSQLCMVAQKHPQTAFV